MKHISWMPVWLATYLFVAGMISASLLHGACTFLLYDNGVPYIWYYGYVMGAVVATPWVWYFTYIGTRYLDSMSLLYRLWVVSPLCVMVYDALAHRAVFIHVLELGETAYVITIGMSTIFAAGIAAFIGYAIWARR